MITKVVATKIVLRNRTTIRNFLQTTWAFHPKNVHPAPPLLLLQNRNKQTPSSEVPIHCYLVQRPLPPLQRLEEWPLVAWYEDTDDVLRAELEDVQLAPPRSQPARPRTNS